MVNGCGARTGVIDARAHLRQAYEAFSDVGARLFAERARIEFLARGERARRRTVEDQPLPGARP